MSGGRYDLGLPGPSLELALCTCFLLVYSPGQCFLRWASWTQAQRVTELSCPWRASCRFLTAPAHPPGAPFLPGCTEPSVCLSKGQGIFLPNPPKTQPALEGFIIMQISWIGSAPAEDSGGGRRTELPLERRVEPSIRPVDGWGVRGPWSWGWCQ